MRLRTVVLSCAFAALAALPTASAMAAPVHDRGLTIHAVPHPILAGEGVLIYGRLTGADSAGQTIRLYHRINPSPRFSVISTTRTNSLGEYEFTRAEGVVLSNRNWFVRGPGLSHSKTVHERVSALVSIAPSSSTGLTRHALTFTGHVTPHHAGSVVSLQEQSPGSGRWITLRRGVLGAGSNYGIPYTWRVAGSYDVRVLLPSDPRNTASASDSTTVVVQQSEVPGFTIASSDQIVANEQPVTISGTLDGAGTTTPQGGTSVSLFAHVPGDHPFREISTTTTGQDGGYSFANLQSTTNELYEVRTTFAPHRRTAALFEGVRDVVTMQSSSQSSTVGGDVAFSGSVSPDKAGHGILLQRLGADGAWHTVASSTVTLASTYSFGWTFGTAGTETFRARITGGPINVGSASSPVQVTVSQPPLTSLPNS